MRELRRIASQGIPDFPGLRSTVWKVTSFSFFFEISIKPWYG